MKIHLTVEMPKELAGEFFQLLRDFDMKHDPGHKDIIRINSLAEGEMTAEEANRMLQVTPTPQFRTERKFD